MTSTHDTTGKRTYRVYADYTTRRYQEVEAGSPQEAFDAASQDHSAWQDCYEHEDGDQYQVSDDVQDVATGEFLTVGTPARCKTCGSDIVEGVNGSNFHDGECGPCEYQRYRTSTTPPPANRNVPRPPTPAEKQQVWEWLRGANIGGTRAWVETECIVVFDHYTTDGPGYAGKVAYVGWGGDPGYVTVLVEENGRLVHYASHGDCGSRETAEPTEESSSHPHEHGDAS